MAKKIDDARVVVTANRLGDGRVVWFDAADGWVEKVGGAAIFEGAAVEGALARAKLWEDREIVVGVYSVPVAAETTVPVPTTARERIRAIGPSVREDLCLSVSKA